MMSQSIKRTISTSLGILGWHGVLLLLLIISSFKIFHLEYERPLEQEIAACPCTMGVIYSTTMFLVPSLVAYIIACFAYFRQDDGSVPWSALKKFYEMVRSCDFLEESTGFYSHTELCNFCRQVERDWTLVKIAVSAVLSLLYPLVWIILSLLQAHYYVCAQVGPSPMIVTSFCNVTIEEDYYKDYALAGIRSKVIGGILFACLLFCAGLFVVLHGEIENYLKKYDESSDDGSAKKLAVYVTFLPEHSSGATDAAGAAASRHSGAPTIASGPGAPEPKSQSRMKQDPNGKEKGIQIHLTGKLVSVLQGSIRNDAWQGVDIRCTQQEERRSLPGCFPFRSPSRAKLLSDVQRKHGYESLREVAVKSTRS